MAKTAKPKAPKPPKQEPLETQLWKAADKLRKNIDAAEYKQVVLGLIFLKYISDAFEELHQRLLKGEGDYAGADPEDRDEYRAENVFFVLPKNMGLSDFEYAFSTAVADNQSARELMQKDKLRELAVVLTDRVRKNATIDWTIKESVRAKLKVIVKRTLRQYGYPPDMQKLATETVLKQAELLAEYFVG